MSPARSPTGHRGQGGSPHDGVGAPFVVVEGVVVNSVPTAMEIVREVDEGKAAVEKCRQVFELLHHDACGRGGGGCHPGKVRPLREQLSPPPLHPIVFIKSSSTSRPQEQTLGASTATACCLLPTKTAKTTAALTHCFPLSPTSSAW